MRFSIYNDARTADLSSVVIRESSVLSLLTHRGCVILVLLTFYIVAPIYYVIAEYICGVSDDQTLSTGINNIYKHAGVHNTFHQAKIQFKVLLLHSVSALTKFQAYVIVHTAIRNCLTVSMGRVLISVVMFQTPVFAVNAIFAFLHRRKSNFLMSSQYTVVWYRKSSYFICMTFQEFKEHQICRCSVYGSFLCFISNF